ncbi:hypothetical protein [Georgenia sp. AZ-5]|uniref:hypothetical protein n=1 Tax=Georgenia sp. AZ-5 TaxID=3367526 RepID=UPI003754230D
MAAEQWALLGVIVGGVLGGLAQIVARSLSERQRHQQWLNEQRMGIYQRYLVEWRSRYEGLWTHHFDGYYQGPDPDEDYLSPLFDLTSDMELFGSKKAVKAAEKARGALVEYWNASTKQAKEKQDAAKAAFDGYLDQIRADLRVR